MATRADRRGWGPGWPNCQKSKMKTLRRADGVVLPVREELALLIAGLCDETERRGYDLIPGWCWGFACRAIRGSRKPSNHSWGLAVDLNAPKNPMTNRLVTDMPSWMPKLWKRYGFGWGGDYDSRPDAMHYEFLGTPADAVRYTRELYENLLPETFEEESELADVTKLIEDIHAAVTNPKDPNNRLTVIDGISKNMGDLQRMARKELEAQGWTEEQIYAIEEGKPGWRNLRLR